MALATLVFEQPKATFDLSNIGRGCLLWGKHCSWNEGKAGFVTTATENELIVQYNPGIGNVTNHFRIPVSEVVEGQWEIRWSYDMSEVFKYNLEDIKEDEETEEDDVEQDIEKTEEDNMKNDIEKSDATKGDEKQQ